MDTRKHVRRFALAVLVLLGTTVPATGLMVELGTAELDQRSGAIVLGTVEAQESHWNEDRTLIETDVTVGVEKAVKGAPGRRVTVRVVGGKVGDMELRSSVDPRFSPGERVVLFLDTAQQPNRLVGRAQGAVPVRDGEAVTPRGKVPVEDFLETIRRPR